MEGHIVFPAETVADGSPDLAAAVHIEPSRVIEFDAEVYAEDQYTEVETYAHTVRPGYLFEELVKLKHTVFLTDIVADSPDVSGVGKGGELDEVP